MTSSATLKPTWTEILPTIITALEDGTPQGKQTAKEELFRMARAADLAVEAKTVLGQEPLIALYVPKDLER
ncbi:MAG: hypothetical protein RDA78_25685 [Roseibium sp.]|uniref:hypothetical protein n=1 Tax=Roseibium sp. TaxID=1936156 RepID=UPI003D9C4E94